MPVPEVDPPQLEDELFHIADIACDFIHSIMVVDILHGRYSTRDAATPFNVTFLDTKDFLSDSGIGIGIGRKITERLHFSNERLIHPDAPYFGAIQRRALVVSGGLALTPNVCKMFTLSLIHI